MMYWWEWVHYGVTGAAVLAWAVFGIGFCVLGYKEWREERDNKQTPDQLLLAENQTLRYERDRAVRQHKEVEARLASLTKAVSTHDPKLGKLSP